MRFSVTLLCFIIILQSCNNVKVNNTNAINDSVRKSYAQGFKITKSGNNKTIQIFNPYQDAKNVAIEYKLTTESNKKTLETNTIKVPVSKVICMSVSYIAFLDKLDELNSIKAMSGTFSYNTIIQQRCANKEIFDIGYEQSINYEKIIQIKPDVVFAYGVREDVSGYISKLQELGIPVVLVGEFLENHPLARAEWIKFFGAFFNKDSLASSIFDSISSKYNNMRSQASKASSKPKVMLNVPWNGSWYIPGGKSFLANLINDAGGDYIWKNIDSHESIPMDIEKVFTQSLNTDIWIHCGPASSLNELTAIDKRLQNLKPFKTKTVFNNNARLSKNGGNDFWESGSLNPQLVLEDLIVILHPELLPGHSLLYYKKLE